MALRSRVFITVSMILVWYSEPKTPAIGKACHLLAGFQRSSVLPQAAAADTTKEEDLQESAATWDETPRQVTVEDAGGSSIAEVAPQALTPLPGEGSAESEGSAISNTMIWLENNALWAGLVVIAAAVGIMVIWKKHRED